MADGNFAANAKEPPDKNNSAAKNDGRDGAPFYSRFSHGFYRNDDCGDAGPRPKPRRSNALATKGKRSTTTLAVLLTALVVLSAIYVGMPSGIAGANAQKQSKGTATPPELMSSIINSGRAPSPANFNVAKGFKMEPLLWNVSFPSSVTFDDKNHMFIAESGKAFGGARGFPRILQVDMQSGAISVVTDRFLNMPITYITYHNGTIYASNGGKISKVDPKTGIVTDLISGFPVGDHPVDQIAFAPDGRMYVAVGSATNSGIVGRDNPWVMSTPKYHDIPGKDVTLAGVNFSTANFYTAEKNDTATTGAYVPFGTATSKGQVIKGDTKCTGCVLSARPNGTDLKLVGWGFRHPYGLDFAQDGKLIVTMNAADERGTRSIANDGDKIYSIDVSNSSSLGQFYGWPDYFGNGEPVTESKFSSPRDLQPTKALIQDAPPVVKPAHVFDVGAALTHIDFSNNSSGKFGYEGKGFIGEFGTLAPQTHLSAVPGGSSPGPVMGQFIGQKVVTFDPKTSEIGTFMSLKTADPTFHPVDVKFSPNGDALYVTSVGRNEVRTITPSVGVLPYEFGQPWGYAYTGTLWKVTHSEEGTVKGTSAQDDGSSIQPISTAASNNGGDEKTIIQGLTIGSSSGNATVTRGNATTSAATTANATGSQQVQPSANVTIMQGAALKRNQAFQPNPVFVKVNGTVTWVNKDGVVHTITSGDEFSSPDMGRQFDSGMLGGVYAHLFNATGTYDYFCQIHPTMKGTVIVR